MSLGLLFWRKVGGGGGTQKSPIPENFMHVLVLHARSLTENITYRVGQLTCPPWHYSQKKLDPSPLEML